MVNSYLKSCFLIFPNYNLGHGLMEMAYNEYINEYYAKIGEARLGGMGSRASSRALEPRECRVGWLGPRPCTAAESTAHRPAGQDEVPI